jgi:tetratricopeptide (TPR) repeat protein
MLRRVLCVVLIALAGLSCSRDPNVVKKKYLQNGNRYFEKGKYREAYIMYRNALKKDARYSEAYYRVGIVEMRMGERIAALRDLRRAADTDPNFTNPDSRVQAGNIVLGEYLMSESRPPGLRDELNMLANELLKHNPKSAQGMRLRGYVKLISGTDARGAVEDFQLANQISPYDPEIVLPLSQALENNGQAAEGERMAKELLARHKDYLPMYDVLYVLYLRSQPQRLDDAEAILRLKVENNPKEPNHLLQLAQHYYRFNKPEEMRKVIDRLVSNRKMYPMGPLQAAKFYAAARDFDDAMKLLEEGSRTDSEHRVEYQKEMAQVLVFQGRKEEAVHLLEQLLKSNPKDEQAQAMRSSLLIETGDPRQIQQAITELQAAVTQDSKNPVLRFNLGRALLAKNQLEQARVQFQEALKLRHEYVPARLALAQLYLINHQFAEAVQTAKEVLDLDPHNLSARLVRTTGLVAMGNPALARTELMDTIAQFPSSADAQVQLGMLDLHDKHFKEAEDRFWKVYREHPGDLSALMQIVVAYVQQKEFDKAIQLLEGEMSKAPNRLQLNYALGNVAMEARKWDLAIEQFQDIISARPDAGDVYIRLGQAITSKANAESNAGQAAAAKIDYEAATRTFDKAKQLRPNDPEAYVQFAMLLESTGRRPQSRPVYEQVLKLQPDNAIALNNLAYLLAETGSAGDLDQALQLAQKAHQKLPDNAEIADTLGWIYIKKNLAGNAVDLFRDLVARETELGGGHDFAVFHYHYGMALVQRGDKPAARRELKLALDRKPSQDDATKIKALLGKIG